MPSVIWNDKVRVVVSEITRGAQLNVWKSLQDVGDDIDIAEYTRSVYSAIMVASTRAVFICENNTWRALDKGQSYDVPVDEDFTFTLTYPPTIEQIEALPVSLANEWAKTAEGVNKYMIDLIFFQEKTPSNTPTTSEPPSDSAS